MHSLIVIAQVTNEWVTYSNQERAESFMVGFAFIFAAGLMGLGARWVRKIIGGGGYE